MWASSSWHGRVGMCLDEIQTETSNKRIARDEANKQRPAIRRGGSSSRLVQLEKNSEARLVGDLSPDLSLSRPAG